MTDQKRHPEHQGSEQLRQLLQPDETLIWVNQPEMTPLAAGTGAHGRKSAGVAFKFVSDPYDELEHIQNGKS